MSQDFFLKYILAGNASVGKTAVLHRFIKNSFKPDTISTVGVDYKARNIIVQDKTFGLMIWDTAGMEAYRSFTQAYFRNSGVAVFLYDVTSRESFSAIPDWIEIVRQNCLDNPHLICVIVGNKCDLGSQGYRKVDPEEGERLAKEQGALFFEASAKTGQNIDLIFEKSAELFYEKYEDGLIDITSDSHGFLLGPKQLDMASGRGEGGYCYC